MSFFDGPEPYDHLQDMRAEHWLETGDTIGPAAFYLTVLTPSQPAVSSPGSGQSTSAPARPDYSRAGATVPTLSSPVPE